MLRSVDLSDYMLTNPVTVSAEDNVFSAIDVIVEQKVSGVCVVDSDGSLLGVLSELDCLRAILSATYNENGDVGNVADFMTGEVDCCELTCRFSRCRRRYDQERSSSSPGGR